MEAVKAYIDISKFWPREPDGQMKSVYSVWQIFQGTEIQINRLPLTNARDGKMASADVTNIFKLSKICSVLAGKPVSIEEIIKIKD